MTIPAEQHELLTMHPSAADVWVDHSALRRWMASCSLETFRYPYTSQRQAYHLMVSMIHTEPEQSQDNGQRGSVQP